MPKTQVRRRSKPPAGLTPAAEDYLKAIFALQQEDAPVTPLAIARRMKVSPPSATGMIQKIRSLGLVRHTHYGDVALTPAGRKVALEILRHHRLIELYLHRALGYSWDEVHEEAERLEHVISEDFEDRITKYLGNPTHDPHGAPIPSKNGALKPGKAAPLTATGAGRRIVIRRVMEGDPEALRYLARLGVLPGVVLKVLEVQPFNGPIRVRLAGGKEHFIGHELAGTILVSAPTPRRRTTRREYANE
ncbi:MAG: metal-dependent transcriptional regulator [bacterium]